MNQLQLSHRIQCFKDSPNGPTLYLFEIFDFFINKSLFTLIKNHPNVVVLRDLMNPGEVFLSNHSRFLEQTVAELVIIPESVVKLRISMAALVALRYEDKIILFRNEKQEAKPFGGAYQVNQGSRFLTQDFITPDDKTSLDLRFTIPVTKLDETLKWFYSKQDRETNPLRELREELSQENDIIPEALWQSLEPKIILVLA